MSKTDHPIIIIGAGPAGLKTASELIKRDLRVTLVDQFADPGASWRQMPAHLKLVSYWKSNCLDSIDSPHFEANAQIKASEFHQYLSQYANRMNLNIIKDHISSVKKDSKGNFVIQGQEKSYQAQVVVNATGYYSNPTYPDFLGMHETNLTILHFKDFVSAENLKSKYPDLKKILLIGKRLSAGQLIEELHSDFELHLSARSAIEHSSMPFIYHFFLSKLDVFEKITLLLKGLNFKKKLDVPMEYQAFKLIQSKGIKIHPNIKCIHSDCVEFEDGEKISPDLILLATGFAPELKHLPKDSSNISSNDFESENISNLFFIGLDNQRSFRSRFLRGIRDDAPELANIISNRLAQS
ncbi:MAG: hypothetical protein EP319_06430 [Deltaproteobacteria bacterium]|nr:MAG: hypothetical protein EP319_06430 [Deltaproteobacteria bacterium]